LRKKILLLGSGFMGLLFLCGFQSPAAIGQTLQPDSDKKVDPCLESTCRDVPLREELTAIDLGAGTEYLRGIAGGFEQGAGIAGGAQFTTAHAIPHLELRANTLTSTRLDRRLDLEALAERADKRRLELADSEMKRLSRPDPARKIPGLDQVSGSDEGQVAQAPRPASLRTLRAAGTRPARSRRPVPDAHPAGRDGIATS